jgi:hypothetical protein
MPPGHQAVVKDLQNPIVQALRVIDKLVPAKDKLNILGRIIKINILFNKTNIFN